MTTIGGAKNLPDFSGVRPLITAEDLTGLRLALEEFQARLSRFSVAANKAESAVEITRAWVGVGEKMLNLLTSLLQARSPDQALQTGQAR
jgi:hypothetical protein